MAGLDGGVVFNVGSAIMGPQVFEKSLSCVNNLRLQEGRPIVNGHHIFVVDLQDGGNWDWSHGEPPKESAAFTCSLLQKLPPHRREYHYLRCDNVAFCPQPPPMG